MQEEIEEASPDVMLLAEALVVARPDVRQQTKPRDQKNHI